MKIQYVPVCPQKNSRRKRRGFSHNVLLDGEELGLLWFYGPDRRRENEWVWGRFEKQGQYCIFGPWFAHNLLDSGNQDPKYWQKMVFRQWSFHSDLQSNLSRAISGPDRAKDPKVNNMLCMHFRLGTAKRLIQHGLQNDVDFTQMESLDIADLALHLDGIAEAKRRLVS